MKFGLLAPCLALFAAGCGGADIAAGGHEKNAETKGYIAVSEYDCGSGSGVRVKWWKGKAEVFFGKEEWTLPLALSGSGARYSDGTREIWEHQGKLRVDDGVSAPLVCPIIRN